MLAGSWLHTNERPTVSSSHKWPPPPQTDNRAPAELLQVQVVQAAQVHIRWHVWREETLFWEDLFLTKCQDLVKLEP